jgi:cytosine deaminase
MPDSQPQPHHSSSSSSSSGSSSSSSGSSGSSASSGRADGADLLLCGARLTDGRLVDVRLSDGRIEAVGTAGSLTAHTARVDLSGHLLLPAPAEPHAHGDTALSADGEGPVSYEGQEVQRRTTEAALLQLGHGATAVRSHVRVGDVQGLGSMAAVLQARRALRGLSDAMLRDLGLTRGDVARETEKPFWR